MPSSLSFGTRRFTHNTRFLLPQYVLNFLYSARLAGAPVAEQPPDAEYDGKAFDLSGTTSSERMG